MFKYLDTYKDAKKLAKQELKSFVQNKTIPFDERWSVFEKYGDGLAEIQSDVFNFTCLSDDANRAIWDDYSRRDIMNTERIFDNLSFCLSKNKPFKYNGWDNTEKCHRKFELTVTEELINTMKEEMMQAFVIAYKIDW